MNPIANPLSWKLQKVSHLYRSFLFHNAPGFVYQPNPAPLQGEIPVFTFHTADPVKFEAQCRYLFDNGYKTLSGDEFLFALSHPENEIVKSVMITFDDGMKTVWTVAYPILKKYRLNAVCFLIPGCIPQEEGRQRPTLLDVWNGKALMADIADPGRGTEALMNWNEIKALHETGLVDFQSHSLNHHLVPVSDQIFEFYHPRYDPYFYGNIHIPVFLENGRDQMEREPSLGMPIYYSKPRMQAKRRYFEDEAERKICIEYVSEHGGESFFQNKKWRDMLRTVVSGYRARAGKKGRFESEEERDRVILEDLTQSKEIIEFKLPGKKITHLCYPWYEAEPFVVEASRKAGYEANYFGNLWGRATNRPGDSPFQIVRVEQEFLRRLPGKGRISALEIFRSLL